MPEYTKVDDRAHLTGLLPAAVVVRLAIPLAPADTHDGQWQLSLVCAIRDQRFCILSLLHRVPYIGPPPVLSALRCVVAVCLCRVSGDCGLLKVFFGESVPPRLGALFRRFTWHTTYALDLLVHSSK